jgi:hypothetical protein
MTQMTLFVRAFNSGQLQQIDDLLQSQFEDLEVKSLLEVDPTSKWVHLSLGVKMRQLLPRLLAKNRNGTQELGCGGSRRRVEGLCFQG